MKHKLKTISKNGIEEALSKAHFYRSLNEPEESESICHDILAADPENQQALRLLGLAITDQFRGHTSDRHAEAEGYFQALNDPYEKAYCLGLLCERRAKAQMQADRPPHSLVVLFEEAMRHFEEAEKLRPPENDDAILRWNRCVRLLSQLPKAVVMEDVSEFEDHDTAPLKLSRRTSRSR